jgi:undecaprenyl-diphosphatase
MGGGSVLNVALKHLFHRPRPVFEHPLVTLSSFSFPSGHAMGSTLFYLLLAGLIAVSVHQWRWRVLAFVTAVGLVLLIGLTRIYLGAHYVSDVLGAMAAGVAWLASCLTAVETLRRRRKQSR